MSALIQDWLNLLFRWVHIVAGIMWIGDSFLFMWLDKNLHAPTKARDGDVAGELWMTHSGGFYEVIKRRSLRPEELGPPLHWFKWESYTTWITGVLLLGVVYHTNHAALLTDPAVAALPKGMAQGLSIAVLAFAFVIYDVLWKTPLAKHPILFGIFGFGAIAGLGFGLLQVFSARGAFLMTGATLGTVMSANVFFRIIPAQKHMLAATRAGTPVDTSYGVRAKGRSIHNHYLTLPVLFTMLSNHFPSLYGSRWPWAVLACMVLFGGALKYVMNFKSKSHPLAWLFLGGSLALGVALTVRPAVAVASAGPEEARVSWATARSILAARCITCHQATPSHPMFQAPAGGVVLDTPEAAVRAKERIWARAVATETMPMSNLTQMTPQERAWLGAWLSQGAHVDAEGPDLTRAPQQDGAP